MPTTPRPAAMVPIDRGSRQAGRPIGIHLSARDPTMPQPSGGPCTSAPGASIPSLIRCTLVSQSGGYAPGSASKGGTPIGEPSRRQESLPPARLKCGPAGPRRRQRSGYGARIYLASGMRRATRNVSASIYSVSILMLPASAASGQRSVAGCGRQLAPALSRPPAGCHRQRALAEWWGRWRRWYGRCTTKSTGRPCATYAEKNQFHRTIAAQ